MLNLNKPVLLGFVLLLLTHSIVRAQYENPVAVDPNVRIGKLANGFTYYVRKNIEPKNRAVLYLATKVGSILENDDQQGVAHFIEHMGFDGTTHYPKNELINYLQKAGVRFGADLNAYTGFDETVYQLPIPTDDPAIVNNGIQIIRDWAQEATLNPADIDKERNVVLEEKRFRSGVGERINRQIYPVIYNNSRYGKRLPIGTEEVLTTVKPETIKQFYHDWYRPDLEAIIAVGDFDVDEMEKTIKSKFSDLKNPENERPRPAYGISFINDHQYTTITDKEQLTTYAEILLKHHTTPVKTEADYIDYQTEALFNLLIQNRYRELKNLGNSEIISTSASIGKSAGRVDIYKAIVSTTPENLEFALKAIWRETIKAAKYGFTREEFTKAYNIFYGGKYYADQQHEKITSLTYVNQYLNNFLKEDPIPGERAELKLVQYLLPKISLLDVDRFGNQYLSSPNRDVIVVAPDRYKGKLPDMQTVEGWLNDVMAENIAIPTDDEHKSQTLLAKKPSKSKIISQKKISGVDVTELVLGNGLKVVLKPTDFGVNDIRFTAFGVGGTDVYNAADRPSATSAAAIVKASGVGELNAIQLKQFLTDHPVNVNPFIDRYTEGVSGNCIPHNLETALQLINQYFTKPHKDSVAYLAYLDRIKTAAANRQNNRDSTLSNMLTSRLNINRAFEIYKERFSNAADFTFVFVGNFDVKEMIPLLERYLGSLPSNTANGTVAKTPPPVSRRSRTIYSGLEPKANVTMRFLGDYIYNPDNNSRFQALTEVMKIRLIERLRQQESGIYSTNVTYNLYTVPANRFVFTINFVCAPDNVDKLVAATWDEIEKIKTAGPDAINIEKYKTANARLMETQVKNNAYWLNYLYQQYLNKADVSDILNYKAAADQLTPEGLKALAANYLTKSNYERLLTLPETAKK